MLLLDNLLHESGSNGQVIDGIGHTLGCLDRSHIGVYKDCELAILTQSLEGL